MSKRKSKHPYFRDRDEKWGIVSTLISPARKVAEESVLTAAVRKIKQGCECRKKKNIKICQSSWQGMLYLCNLAKAEELFSQVLSLLF